MAHRSVPDDETIGDRLRRLRTERGLTQGQLAEAAHLSVDLVKKLEQGRRQSARLTSLTALTYVLDVPRSELLDKRPRLDGGGTLVLGVRDALITPDLLVEHDDGEAPTDPAVLWTHVECGWRDYWGGDFVALAQSLPGLIGEARVAQRALGVPAVGPLAQSYQLAGCLLVQLGREDLAALAAERGIGAALLGDDELQWAALHGTYAWALIGQARNLEAEQLAIRAAARVEPDLGTAAPEVITVWGGLVLWANAAAVEASRGDAVREYLALARSGVARLPGGERYDYQQNFGATQVAMQTTYAYSVLGEPGRALAAARGVRREDLRTISYGRHLLDVALANVDARRADLATVALKEAKDLAPVWFRHQPAARTLVADLAERQSRLSPVLRELVRSLNTH